MARQARAGIGRAGVMRANRFRSTMVLTIAGVDRSEAVIVSSLNLSLSLSDEPNTARFQLQPGTVIPSVGQAVVIAIGAAGNVVFRGQIESRTLRYLRGVDTAVIEVVCGDNTRALGRRLVTQEWRDTSATAIAREIIDTYSDGLTHNSVEPGLPVLAQFSAINVSVVDALRSLASQIGGGMAITGTDVALWGSLGPQYRLETNPSAISLESLSLHDVSYTLDLSQVRTRIIAEGKTTSTLVGTPDGATSVVVGATAAVDYLVVAGGGGGSTFGGGGGGGVLSGTTIVSSADGAITVTVGVGGPAGTNGNNSVFGAFTAIGGGRGGSASVAGATGGSGGGGGSGTAAGSGTSGQGSAGGPGFAVLGGAGGGGGGAAGTGGAAYILFTSEAHGGNGGAGRGSAASGTLAYYGGGGGGGGPFGGGAGGLGGGGGSGVAGTANTGGGGGASAGGGLAGGSGIVILSYVTGSLTATGGTATVVGDRTIRTYTTTGSSSFTPSDVVYVAPVPTVTDLPIADGTALEPSGGTVRIGPHVVTYTGLIGPETAPGVNLPGSTLTSDVAVGATSMPVDDLATFTETAGWVRAGDQVVRYSSQGGGALTGVPSSGFGSIASPLSAGTAVSWLPAISFAARQFFPSITEGVEVVQRVTVNDTTAQAYWASVEGGDGIYEYPVSHPDATLAALTAQAAQTLAAFAFPVDTASWETDDKNAYPGRLQLFGLTTDVSSALRITQVEMTWPHRYANPRRRCEAASTRQRAFLDAISVKR